MSESHRTDYRDLHVVQTVDLPRWYSLYPDVEKPPLLPQTDGLPRSMPALNAPQAYTDTGAGPSGARPSY